ncbi:LytTR family DNA-binding domain-containing protein [Maritalea sp. S77]|uniref:LytTR family DNA-binding domain-containing protein n=1 Tax=Maritalea sp. S77 TaxID=3415125 RepID=UPI003C7EBE25
MKEGPLQLTLREMREMFSSARVWAGIITVAVMIGIIGPFQTFSYFPTGPRIVYWLITVVITYLGGVFAGSLVVNAFEHYFRANNPVLHILVAGTAAGTAVSVLITLINGIALGDWEIPGFHSIMPWVYCVAISICISALHFIFQRPQSEVINPPKQVPLMARLNVKNRGQLFYLSMQDHYVNIVTSKGAELVLLRLADAIKETDGVVGVKIHRSHWVALDAVAETRKKGSGMVAVMKDGAELPISRGQMDEVRLAGLLPAAPQS